MIQAKELSIFRPGIIPMLIMIQLIVLFPLWFELPIWISGVTIAILSLKYLSYKSDINLPYWLIIIFVILAFSGVFFYFKTISGRDAGVALICLMYCFKLVESKSYRDAALVLFLSFFIMVMAFLFNQSIIMGFYLLVTVTSILSGLIALNSVNGFDALKNLGRISVNAVFQAMPIMIILFFVFPRLPGPLWGWDDNRAGTGISDSMSPGSVSSLINNDEPAFRVKFNGNAPSADQMYWRGLTMSNFDGFIWRATNQAFQKTDNIPPSTLLYDYRINLEPNYQKWLFGLEHLGNPDSSIILYEDFTWAKLQKNSKPFSYKGVAVDYNYNGYKLTDYARNNYTRLPSSGNILTKQWAKDVYQKGSGTEEFIRRVLNHINIQDYYYTRTPEVLLDNVVDGFWLKAREGFCEHYAGAFVFIMRAAGVPARVVAGYQGGEYNPYGDYYLVKQSDAHAWAEVWIDDKGWVRVDPTSAIHPSRVETNLLEQTNRRESWFGNKRIAFDLPESFLTKMRMRWDAIKSFWDDTLMGYGQEQQNDWLSKLGIKSNQWRYLGYGLVAVLLFSGLIFGLWLLRHSRSKDPIEIAYLSLKSKLIKQGVEIQANWGPQSLLKHLQQNHPELSKKYATAIKSYMLLRYKSESATDEWLKRFQRQVKKL